MTCRCGVFSSFASGGGRQTSLNVRNRDDVVDIYLKTSFVTLASVKQNNPDFSVHFVSNFDIDKAWADLFESENVAIVKKPFDSYLFSEECTWGLAYYKLDVLRYALKKYDYDVFIFLDADVLCTDSLEVLVEEACRRRVPLLYECQFPYNHEDLKIMRSEAGGMLGDSSYLLTSWGGEIICGTRECLLELEKKCANIYTEMKRSNLESKRGDEFILASASVGMNIARANPYIERFWLGKTYRFVSTAWVEKPLWHLPGEKERGFETIYSLYEKTGNFVGQKEKFRKRIGLPAKGYSNTLGNLYRRFAR